MEAIKPTVGEFNGPRGQLQRRCGHCTAASSSALSLCTGCKVLRYCNREHQIAHRPAHKEACNKIKKLRSQVAREEDKIRNATPDFMTPANAFETHVGHFWGIPHTRDYMRPRFFLADAIRRTGTLEGVQEGLDHMKDMLRLCRSDNLGVRQIVPALMLQLDQDQQCYDFIKWYQTEGRRDDYDWSDLELPFLDVKGADVFESTKFMDQKYGDAHHCTALILLKIKILIDVMNIRLTRKALDGKLPVELWQGVELAVIRSPLSAALTKRSSLELVALEGKLIGNLLNLGSFLREANDNVITGLLNPDEWLTDIPATMSHGSTDEMQILLQHSFAAWWQMEGALELLHASRKIAAADSAGEIEGMMGASTFKNGGGAQRTKEELLEDVSLNRIWGYLHDAVQDAGSLAVERPSGVHLRALKAMADEVSDDEYGIESNNDYDDGYQMT